MKTKLEQIYQKKKKTIRAVNKINIKYLVAIYRGIINNKSIREIHKDIRKITKYNPDFDLRQQERYVTNLAKITKKQTSNSLDIALAVYELFKKKEVEQELKVITYKQARVTESKEKINVINDTIKENRLSILIDWGKNRVQTNARIFYLASSHGDCAIDHKDYQGKLYIDQVWEKYIKDEELISQIKEFINANDIKTIQWVINRPVWFVTRPNCRHYFKVLTLEEVLNNDIAHLINEYKMYTPIGNREHLQTLYHSTNKKWYTEENIKNIIVKYQDRLNYHEELNSVKSTDTLEKAIYKDKLLIKKWKSYLSAKYNN